MSGNENTLEHREYNDGGYEDISFGYGSDYDKDTDDLYQFDGQDTVKNEEHFPEAPGSDNEEVIDDLFDQQYDYEDEQQQ